MSPLAAGRVALSVLVVSAVGAGCGDDDPAGTGGAGGAGSTTATGTTTSSTGATTTSSTSGAGGDGGQGGGGDGGAGGGDGGGESTACETLGAASPPLTVVTVDETGAPVEVERVVWQEAFPDPFWLEPEEAVCAGGTPPPCSTWEIAGELPERIAVTSERTTEATDEDCIPYASSFALVHLPDGAATAPQLLHLTLPSDGTYCVDPGTGRSAVDHEQDEQVDEADCLVPPPEAGGAIELTVVDLDGEPVPAASAVWYYPPEGPDHDGEHPLACLDQRCERWVVTEAPQAGTIYLFAMYAGPLNPFVQTGWSDGVGTPVEVEVDDRGEIVPVSVELVLDTTLEGAIGG